MRGLVWLSVLWLVLVGSAQARERAAVLFVNRDGSLLDAPRQQTWEGPALTALASTDLAFEPAAALFDSLSSVALPLARVASSDAMKAHWLVMVTVTNQVALVDAVKDEVYWLGRADGAKPDQVMRQVADLVGKRLSRLTEEQGPVVGNTDSHMYHLTSADHTDPARLVRFPDEQSARAAGYHACPICFPAPDPEREDVGPSLSQVMRLEYAVDKHDDPALEEVARRLALASHLDAHVLAFHRATTDDVFSVSYPSGDTWLSDGLIRILESPDERAAVVAHEMAHVALGHFATWYADQDEPPVFMGLDRGDYLLRLNHHLLKEGWPAWMEDEADGQAILYMERAGYNPAAYAATLHKIQESRHAKTDWTHVHPLSAERWKNIQTWPERLGEVGDLSHAAAAFDPGLAASLEAHRVSLATALPATRAFVGLMQAAAAAGLPVRGEPVRLP